MIAITPRETIEYVLKDEEKNADKTVWILRALTLEERNILEDMIGGPGDHIPFGTVTTRALKLALSGWRNWKDEAGQEISFATERLNGRDEVKSELLNRLPAWARFELGMTIMETNKLSVQDAKNLP